MADVAAEPAGRPTKRPRLDNDMPGVLSIPMSTAGQPNGGGAAPGGPIAPVAGMEAVPATLLSAPSPSTTASAATTTPPAAAVGGGPPATSAAALGLVPPAAPAPVAAFSQPGGSLPVSTMAAVPMGGAAVPGAPPPGTLGMAMPGGGATFSQPGSNGTAAPALLGNPLAAASPGLPSASVAAGGAAVTSASGLPLGLATSGALAAPGAPTSAFSAPSGTFSASLMPNGSAAGAQLTPVSSGVPPQTGSMLGPTSTTPGLAAAGSFDFSLPTQPGLATSSPSPFVGGTPNPITSAGPHSFPPTPSSGAFAGPQPLAGHGLAMQPPGAPSPMPAGASRMAPTSIAGDPSLMGANGYRPGLATSQQPPFSGAGSTLNGLNAPLNGGPMHARPSVSSYSGQAGVSIASGSHGGVPMHNPAFANPAANSFGAAPNGVPAVGGGGGGGGGAFPGQQAASQSSNTTDQRRRAIQQQLLLLIHAHKCKLPQATDKRDENACRVLHCGTMKNVLQHMSQCKLGRQCQFAHCGSSRQIIAHYSHCKNPACPICAPLRRSNPGRPTINGGPGGPGQPNPNAMAGGMRPIKAEAAMGRPVGAPMQAQPMAGQQRNGLNPGVGGVQGGQPMAADWRTTLQATHRQKLVQKLVEALIDCVSPEDQQEKRTPIRDLAVKIEETVYTRAQKREDYYHLLAEKIYKLKKAQEQRKSNVGGPGLGPPPAGSYGGPRVWRQDELLHHFGPLHNQLVSNPESAAFREPVDPVKLQILDYPKIIKHPMDLQTIGQKLQGGKYTDPWQYCDDVRLMWDNAWLYNKKSTRIHKIATKLSELWEGRIDSVMRRMGFCCGRRHYFSPTVLYCAGKQVCIIPHGASYLTLEAGVSAPVNYCSKCFKEMEDEIELPPEEGSRRVPKHNFVEHVNNKLEQEPSLRCTQCNRKHHQICSLWHKDIGRAFVCPTCTDGRRTGLTPYTASRLPRTFLGDFLERKVNQAIGGDAARDCGEISVRVLSIRDKQVDVKERMLQHYTEQGDAFPPAFPYKAKAVFVFQRISNADVCFFGMHTQEYGSDCPEPNARRVYIGYLDSVKFFQPKYLRTGVYHELLIAYLEYCKTIGFNFAHIWACPPSPGDDYIFYCHPKDQKVPKPKRLQDWYKTMLKAAKSRRIIYSFCDLNEWVVQQPITHAKQLPYFEGDYWPGILEEVIKELKNHEDGMDLAGDTTGDAGAAADKGASKDSSKSKAKSKAKGSKKKGKSSKKSSKKGRLANLEKLLDRLCIVMEKHKDVFFVVQLQPNPSATSQIVQRDSNMVCELMDGRDAFLTMCRDNHYEFSSLRRTRFSTMMMLHALHTNDTSDFSYNCNACQQAIPPMAYRFHCTNTATCPDFDLCAKCYEKEKHPHPMEQLGFGMGDDGSGVTPADKKKQSIQKCIASLVHASQCTLQQCPNPSCAKMKQVVAHSKTCPTKAPTCSICKQLVALCCYHAKNCLEPQCPVPFCQGIKARLQQQQHQQREASRRMQARRMYMMQASAGGDGGRAMAARSAVASAGAAAYSGASPMAATPAAGGTMARPVGQVMPGASVAAAGAPPPGANSVTLRVQQVTLKLQQLQKQLTALQQHAQAGRPLTPEQQRQQQELSQHFKRLYVHREQLLHGQTLNPQRIEQARLLVQRLRTLTPQQQQVAMQQMSRDNKLLLQQFRNQQQQQQLQRQQQQRQQQAAAQQQQQQQAAAAQQAQQQQAQAQAQAQSQAVANPPMPGVQQQDLMAAPPPQPASSSDMLGSVADQL